MLKLQYFLLIAIVSVSLVSCQDMTQHESAIFDPEEQADEDAPRFSYEFFYDHTEESRFLNSNYPSPHFNHATPPMALFYRKVFASRIKRTDNETGDWIVMQSNESGERYAEIVIDVAKQHYWGRGVSLDQAMTNVKNGLIHYVHLLRGALADHQEKVDEYETKKGLIRERLARQDITPNQAESLLRLEDNQIGYLQRDMALIQSRLDKVLSILNSSEMDQVDYDWQRLDW